MLEIIIPEVEHWDDDLEEFYKTPGTRGKKIQLEHSLVSISKWESKWHKAFLKEDEKTLEEIVDYIRCMTITKGVPDDAYDYIPIDIVKTVVDYMENKMSASCIIEPLGTRKVSGGRKETVTSELIYYWMIALNIPLECEKWHLNRLLTLIRIAEAKNKSTKDAKGIDKREAARQRAAMNKARRSKHRSRG